MLMDPKLIRPVSSSDGSQSMRSSPPTSPLSSLPLFPIVGGPRTSDKVPCIGWKTFAPLVHDCGGIINCMMS
jgi:hypothetical protein